MNLSDIAKQLGSLSAKPEYRDAAIRNLTTWWNGEQYQGFRPQLVSLAERGKWDLILDSFYRVMTFGTSGRRGPVGIGPNRINQDTVASSVQGHVNYLRRRNPNADLRVVVACDVRVFRDLRGLYDPGKPNPLMGMSSRDFARLASAIYAANGVEVYTAAGDDGFFMATPELSFAIRHLKAHGGLNISASHNHPDDNGAKFYMASGGQPIPPDDEALADEVTAVTSVPAGDFEAAVRDGKIHWWGAALHLAYLDENLACSIDSKARGALIVFSPLHGTGHFTVGELLPLAGFDVRYVQRQNTTDGAFPNVKFRMPNPEVPEAMELLIEEARAAKADVGMATDPDADRLGVVAEQDGAWRSFSGNEIAVVLAAYICETRAENGTLPKNGFLVKTAVTTELLTKIAQKHRLQMLGDLLVGFKYIGQVLDEIEANGSFRSVHATTADFLLAAEESNGVLVSAALRDKDAAGGALLIGELCSRLRAKGSGLGAYLNDVYRRYGYASNTGYSVVAEGISGLELVKRMMDEMRKKPLREIGGRKLQTLADYWDEKTFGPIVSETDRSSRNFIRLVFERDLVVSIRPSGTEPKIKVYVEQVFQPEPSWTGPGFAAVRQAMDESTKKVTLSIVEALLALVDIHLPRPALVLSSLISLDNRIDFASRFLPELEKRLESNPDDTANAAWIDTRLAAYGTDPRYLVRSGLAEYLAEAKMSAPVAGRIRQLFFLPS